MFDLKKEENKVFIKENLDLNFVDEHISLIKDFYDEIAQQIQGDLPIFYNVNKIALSMNLLQYDRYLEEDFLYYQTNYSKTIKEKIDKIFYEKENCTVLLKGLQGSGKSYFLSDFVLRNRINGIDSKLRILYVNNSDFYMQKPLLYIFNELKYMLCFDIAKNDQFSKEIMKWFQLFKEYPEFYDIKKFLAFLKKEFNLKGIKMILVWDQINILYRKKADSQNAFNYFVEIINNYTFFNVIFLSASNNNEQINTIKAAFSIEFDPFQVFTMNEIYNLIKIESFNLYRPKDIDNLKVDEYSISLCSSFDNSISEYYYYKKCLWNDNLKKSFINQISQKEAFSIYLEKRKAAIHLSEQNFRNEYIKNTDVLAEYYKTIKKILSFEEYRNLNVDDIVSCLNFINLLIFKEIYMFENDDDDDEDEEPTLYNHQLLYYDSNKKLLLCNSRRIKEEIINLKLHLKDLNINLFGLSVFFYKIF